MEIRAGGLDDPAVQALLRFHLENAHRLFPTEFAHALPVDGLRDPSIAFFSAWDGEVLLGVAALKRIDDGHGEIKSMRTHPDHVGRGVGRRLLEHLVAEARRRGYARLSLETGTTPDFAAAHRLYEGAGFIDGPVFGDYPASPYNRFMTLALA